MNQEMDYSSVHVVQEPSEPAKTCANEAFSPSDSTFLAKFQTDESEVFDDTSADQAQESVSSESSSPHLEMDSEAEAPPKRRTSAASSSDDSAVIATEQADNSELINQVSSRNSDCIPPTTSEDGSTYTCFRDIGIGGTSSSGATILIARKASQGSAAAAVATTANDALLKDFISHYWTSVEGQKVDDARDDADAHADHRATTSTASKAADSIHARTDGNVEVSRDGGCLFKMSSDKSFCEQQGILASGSDGEVAGRPSAASLCVTKMENDDISVLTEVVMPDRSEDAEARTNADGKCGKEEIAVAGSPKSERDRNIQGTKNQEREQANATTTFAPEWTCTPTLNKLKELLNQTKMKSDQVVDFILKSDVITSVTNTPAYKRLFKPSLRSASSSGCAMKRLALAKKGERKTLEQSHTKITAFVHYKKRQEKAEEAQVGLGDDARDDARDDHTEALKTLEQTKVTLLAGDDEQREVAPKALAEETEEVHKDIETPTAKESEIAAALNAGGKQAKPKGILRKGSYQPLPDSSDKKMPDDSRSRSNKNIISNTGRFSDTSSKAGRDKRPSHSNRYKSIRPMKKKGTKNVPRLVQTGLKRRGADRSSFPYVGMI